MDFETKSSIVSTGLAATGLRATTIRNAQLREAGLRVQRTVLPGSTFWNELGRRLSLLAHPYWNQRSARRSRSNPKLAYRDRRASWNEDKALYRNTRNLDEKIRSRQHDLARR